jgi:hypothetical protein
MNFDAHSYIVRALVPVALTALGTLAFECCQYAFFVYPHEIRELRESYQSEQKRIIAVQAYKLAFLNAEKLVFSHSMNRTRSFIEISRSMPLGRDPRTLNLIHTKASETAHEANSDYGMLLAFTPDGKYLTQAARDAAVGMAAADAEMWQTLYRCSKPGMALSEAGACNNEIPSTEFDQSKALAFATSTHDSDNFTNSLIEIDQERNRQQYETRENEMWRWYSASMVGFILSIVAYFFIIGISIDSFIAPAQIKQAIFRPSRGFTKNGKSAQRGNGLLAHISWCPTLRASGRHGTRL